MKKGREQNTMTKFSSSSRNIHIVFWVMTWHLLLLDNSAYPWGRFCSSSLVAVIWLLYPLTRFFSHVDETSRSPNLTCFYLEGGSSMLLRNIDTYYHTAAFHNPEFRNMNIHRSETPRYKNRKHFWASYTVEQVKVKVRWTPRRCIMRNRSLKVAVQGPV
jgi:hypothetical protein